LEKGSKKRGKLNIRVSSKQKKALFGGGDGSYATNREKKVKWGGLVERAPGRKKCKNGAATVGRSLKQPSSWIDFPPAGA